MPTCSSPALLLYITTSPRRASPCRPRSCGLSVKSRAAKPGCISCRIARSSPRRTLDCCTCPVLIKLRLSSRIWLHVTSSRDPKSHFLRFKRFRVWRLTTRCLRSLQRVPSNVKKKTQHVSQMQGVMMLMPRLIPHASTNAFKCSAMIASSAAASFWPYFTVLSQTTTTSTAIIDRTSFMIVSSAAWRIEQTLRK